MRISKRKSSSSSRIILWLSSVFVFLILSDLFFVISILPGNPSRSFPDNIDQTKAQAPLILNTRSKQAVLVKSPNDEEDQQNSPDKNYVEISELEEEGVTLVMERVWLGDVRPLALQVSVVISHCEGNLFWLREYLSDIPVSKISIVSRCGVVPEKEHLPEGTHLLQLSNIGRCDHTVAYWMTEMVHSNDEDGIIVFLKDNLEIHQTAERRGILDMISVAFVNGFGCSLQPIGKLSYFHDTATLASYNMTSYGGVPKLDEDGNLIMNANDLFKSQFENMGAWLDRMAVSLPTPYTPVCYGGIFAVRKSRMTAVPMHVRQNLKQSLERGDNIEEGHFAERTWAGLFSEPISSFEMKVLADMTKNVCHFVAADGGGMLGALMLEPSTYLEESWEALPDYIKDAARSLGIDESTWDMDAGPSTILQKRWEDLTNQGKGAAEYIGFNQIEWDRQ